MSKKRQLSALMQSSIKGYHVMLQKDEANAIEVRNSYHDVLKAFVEKYNGKVLKYLNEGTLSVFNSSVEAVNCAIDMQKTFSTNSNIPVNVGIHVGDVVIQDDDIIGDAVNIVSKIEALSITGGILISDKVHDQIRSHRDINPKFLSAFDVQDVEEPLLLFAIKNEGLIVPSVKYIKDLLKENSISRTKPKKKNILFIAISIAIVVLALFWLSQNYIKKGKVLSDNSIAVLPFDNLSTDDDAEIFRDGMTEDILTNLSKLKELHVISRTSVMQYKDTKKTIPEIAKELGVAYVLEGSIRKYGDKIRVTAQLIEANSDEHLWAENYDRTITDIFAIQTEVSNEIVRELELNISFEEQKSIDVVPVRDIEAYKFFLKAKREVDKRNKESIAKSIELLQQAIAIDPNYSEAYAEIANSVYLETYYSGRDHIEAGKVAREYLEKAEKLNNKVSRIYSVKGLILNIEGKTELAKAAFNKALALSPNDLTARYQFANLHYYTQEYEKQLEQAEMAYRLDPLSFASANAYFTALLTNKKFDKAETLMKKIDADGIENNQVVIHRSFFRLYMDMRDYKECVFHLEKIVDEAPIVNRFLGYCYAKEGDTLGAYRMIDDVYNRTPPEFKSHQLSVIYSGLKKTDSVLYHLDTIRNKRTGLIMRDRGTFFEYLEGNPKFIEVLKGHGLEN